MSDQPILPTSEDEVDAGKMPLLAHLIELRNRLMWSVGAIIIAFIGCYFFAPDIFQFLAKPLALAAGRDVRIISTAPQEIFFTYMKIAFWAAVCLAFPIIASQIWMFVAPGLYKNEKRAFLPFLFATPILFTMGAALVYFLVMPLALQFFFSFEVTSGHGMVPIENETRIAEYLSLVMSLMFAFGVSFQMPVLLTLMARAGLVSAAGLASKRRVVIVGIFIFAAILTPPDVISQTSLAIPLLLLYEISIWLAKGAERERGETP